MFKIGNKVKVIYKNSVCSRKNHGRIFRIVATFPDGYSKLDCNCCPEKPMKCGGIWNTELILVKNNPITEEDYLDCFKENFREGV